MLDELWNRFKGTDYSGSVSVKSESGDGQIHFALKSDSSDDDSFIHEAIYEMDPDYMAVCVIRSGFTGDTGSLPVVGIEGWQSDKGRAAEALDNAILEGLGHKKAFVIKGSGAVVKFGYEGDTIV